MPGLSTSFTFTAYSEILTAALSHWGNVRDTGYPRKSTKMGHADWLIFACSHGNKFLSHFPSVVNVALKVDKYTQMAEYHIIQTSAPAKVILFGEHSVVYGAPAIAAALDGRTVVNMSTLTEKIIQFVFPFASYNIPLPISNTITSTQCTDKSYTCAVLMCQHFKDTLNKGDVGLKVVLSSALPIGAGLGSSASFSVSLSAAFCAYEAIQDKVSLQKNSNGTVSISALESRIKTLANECEVIFHGNPSGIDTAVCLLGGIIKYERTLGVQKIAEDLPIKIAVVDTEISRQTSALVQRVVDLRGRFPQMVENVIVTMKSVAEAAIEEITNPNPSPEKLMELARFNHGLLYSLGVSHPRLEKINQVVSDMGVGFKLTGAGGGGNAILFIPPNVNETEIINKLKSSGFSKALVVQAGGPGLQIELLS